MKLSNLSQVTSVPFKNTAKFTHLPHWRLWETLLHPPHSHTHPGNPGKGYEWYLRAPGISLSQGHPVLSICTSLGHSCNLEVLLSFNTNSFWRLDSGRHFFFFNQEIGKGWASLLAQTVKNLPAHAGDAGSSLCQEDTLEKEWLPTAVFLPGKSHGQRRLGGYNPQGHKKLDTTVRLTLHFTGKRETSRRHLVAACEFFHNSSVC